MKESNGGEVPVLKFHEGTLVLENPTWRPDWGDPPSAVWDPRSRQWRARAMYYRDLIEWFRFKKIPLEDRAVQFARLDLRLRLDVELHSYQREALDAWVEADGRGSVCLPTGSGKTMVALKAIEHVGQSTLVVLPTIDLIINGTRYSPTRLESRSVSSVEAITRFGKSPSLPTTAPTCTSTATATGLLCSSSMKFTTCLRPLMRSFLK